ncbi:ubiquitin-like protein [Clavulina sp. PMI_390]|nr:ubiquitin-like protein [Clavulina sp. PMI_390]
MQITIMASFGKIIKLNVQYSNTIEDVKVLIEDEEGVPRVRQRIIHAGKYLDDKKTLLECFIYQESTLHLVPSQTHLDFRILTTQHLSSTIEFLSFAALLNSARSELVIYEEIAMEPVSRDYSTVAAETALSTGCDTLLQPSVSVSSAA